MFVGASPPEIVEALNAARKMPPKKRLKVETAAIEAVLDLADREISQAANRLEDARALRRTALDRLVKLTAEAKLAGSRRPPRKKRAA